MAGQTAINKRNPPCARLPDPSKGGEEAEMVAYVLIVREVFKKCCFVTTKLPKSKYSEFVST